MSDKVQAWSEIVKIPTYKIGVPNKNLMFLEKWVYQGSSGAASSMKRRTKSTLRYISKTNISRS